MVLGSLTFINRSDVNFDNIILFPLALGAVSIIVLLLVSSLFVWEKRKILCVPCIKV